MASPETYERLDPGIFSHEKFCILIHARQETEVLELNNNHQQPLGMNLLQLQIY